MSNTQNNVYPPKKSELFFSEYFNSMIISYLNPQPLLKVRFALTVLRKTKERFLLIQLN